MKSGTNNAFAKARGQALGGGTAPVAQNPTCRQDDFYSRVRCQQMLKQLRVLKKRIPLRRIKVRAAAGVPQAIFMMQDPVVVQVQD